MTTADLVCTDAGIVGPILHRDGRVRHGTDALAQTARRSGPSMPDTPQGSEHVGAGHLSSGPLLAGDERRDRSGRRRGPVPTPPPAGVAAGKPNPVANRGRVAPGGPAARRAQLRAQMERSRQRPLLKVLDGPWYSDVNASLQSTAIGRSVPGSHWAYP